LTDIGIKRDVEIQDVSL